jgi:tryptophanyl-tRNA synthetase
MEKIKMDKQQIDPWGSLKLENYEHIFKEFGLNKFEDYSLTDNYLFQRKIIIAERDFQKIKTAIKNKTKFAQITGIASSGDLHLGHKLDIDYYKLFKKLGAKSKFAVCDIDGYVSRQDTKIENIQKAKEFAVKNTADIIALGVPPEEIYVQSQQKPHYYQLCFEASKKITENMFNAIYGHNDFGKISAVLLQISDILHIQLPEEFGKCPTITGIGLEQDPHARITRDLAKRLNYDFEVPSFFYFTHQSGLKENSKMSSSDPDTAIFLGDTEKDINKKINKAFSGGRLTIEEQKQKGGQPEICKVYEIFKFHNPDSKFVQETYSQCKSGKLMCGECKNNCISFLTEMLKQHQEKAKEALPIAKKIVYGK